MVSAPVARGRDETIACVALMGATGTGKSDAGLDLAVRFGGEIVSMDSRQVYRGMDVGTAKVPAAARERVPHHLVDVADPTETWSAGRHAEAAHAAAQEVAARGRVPFFVGGTGLYFRAVFEGLIDVRIPRETASALRAAFVARTTADLYAELARRDPRRAARVSPNDRVRIGRALELIAYTGRTVTELYAEGRARGPSYDPVRLVLTMPRPRLRERVAELTRRRFAAGWPDEVRRLLADGVPLEAPGMASLGYRAIAEAIVAGRPAETVLDAVVTATQRYAKRQETFFRSEPGAVWVDMTGPEPRETLARLVARHLRGDEHE